MVSLNKFRLDLHCEDRLLRKATQTLKDNPEFNEVRIEDKGEGISVQITQNTPAQKPLENNEGNYS